MVPCRNEASRLESTFHALEPLLQRAGGTEIIFAIDSTSDDGTLEVGKRLARDSSHVRLEVVDSTGKGYAVAVGVASARGDVVVMADADLSVKPAQFEELIVPAESGDIAIASRSVRGSRRIGEPRMRYMFGRLFNLAVRLLVLPGVRDTQCGFKAFPRDVFVPVFAGLKTEGWCFDVEVLAQARRRGVSVKEVPVEWKHGHGSKVRVARDAAQIVRDLWRLHRRLGRVPEGGPAAGVP